jgi:ABC-type amino acid transport substrate-binding protein
VTEPRPLASVPSLEELAEQPEAFDSLPPLAQAALVERVEVLAARLRVKLLAARTAAGPAPAASPDRAVGLEEASGLLGLSRDFLYRHWKKLGGYKDDDSRVRFTMSTIQRRLQHHARR